MKYETFSEDPLIRAGQKLHNTLHGLEKTGEFIQDRTYGPLGNEENLLLRNARNKLEIEHKQGHQ